MVLANEFVRDGFSPLYDSCASHTVTEVAREVQNALAVWEPSRRSPRRTERHSSALRPAIQLVPGVSVRP